jgi:hypothetical protein
MTKVTQLREVDIPCKITIDAGTEYAHVYYRTDPTKEDGWINCSPLGLYFTMEERKRIKKTLQKQGWYTRMWEYDNGCFHIIKVEVCTKEGWYKSEEK